MATDHQVAFFFEKKDHQAKNPIAETM